MLLTISVLSKFYELSKSRKAPYSFEVFIQVCKQELCEENLQKHGPTSSKNEKNNSHTDRNILCPRSPHPHPKKEKEKKIKEHTQTHSRESCVIHYQTISSSFGAKARARPKYPWPRKTSLHK